MVEQSFSSINVRSPADRHLSIGVVFCASVKQALQLENRSSQAQVSVKRGGLRLTVE